VSIEDLPHPPEVPVRGDDDAAGAGTAAAVEDRSGAGAQASGAAGGAGMALDALNDPQSPLSRRVVYFEFDSSLVRSEDRPTIEAHASYLAANPGVSVVLEGHADERGTREYNVGLSERRAHAVSQLLTLQGVQARQIETVSYGEERPAVDGHDESAWQLNRRVEFVYSR